MADILVRTDGTIQFVHSDELVPLLQYGATHGKTDIQRVSHVESPDGLKWAADMSPVDGPTLGPFDLRGDALNAERVWLRDNLNL